MKIKILVLSLAILSLAGCSDNVLDRPQLTSPDDSNYWVNEDNLRLYMNECYPYFFTGYNTTWGLDYAPLRGYNFSDDLTTTSNQTPFENSVPDARGSNNNTNATPPAWLQSYAGPTWYFGWIRKSNLMMDRMETLMKTKLTTEAYNHWTGVARFFKGLDYCRLVGTFGAVPYFDKNFITTDNDIMYKDRDARSVVMDKVYDDFKFALANVRANDGVQYVNKNIVAGFVSRWMLFAGTWAKYHDNDTERAKKYLQLSADAADMIIISGKYKIDGDFRSLFSSNDLSGNKECILYRHYDNSAGIRHCVASYSSGYEAQESAANLSLVKAFICNDGQAWQNSTLANADLFNLGNLVKTRDPRFEATFAAIPWAQSATYLYSTKFTTRAVEQFLLDNNTTKIPSEFQSINNVTDYPVIRYSEVLLNWIEAKAELAQLGAGSVSQGDINKSINDIRNRPLDAAAIAKGVKKTEPMNLAALPNDPARDADVPALIWEIRRERRMEFVYEHSRLLDIKRWKKLDYMNTVKYPDNKKSIWINFKVEAPQYMIPGFKNKITVLNAAGNTVTFDGTNADAMVGYYIPEKVADRDAFTDRSYLSPVAKGQIDMYQAKGYTLTQTTGW